MRESVFQTEVVNSFKRAGHWAYKIADVPVRGGQRFTATKPFDLVVFVHGHAVAVECKQMKRYEAFGISAMEESQIKSLDEISRKRAGRCYVFLNVRLKGINRLYAFRWAPLRRVWSMQGSIKADALRLLRHVEGEGGLYPLHDWLAEEKLLGGGDEGGGNAGSLIV